MFLSKIPGMILLHRKILDCVTINILSNWHKSNLSLQSNRAWHSWYLKRPKFTENGWSTI